VKYKSIKFISRPIWYRYEQEFGASFNGSPYKAVMSSYVYKQPEVYLERNVSFLECLGGLH